MKFEIGWCVIGVGGDYFFCFLNDIVLNLFLQRNFVNVRMWKNKWESKL